MLPLEQTATTKEEEPEMALTARGTLPGITTIWSDGSVTLHAVTADVVSEVKHDQHRGKRERQRKKRPQLELRQLWRVYSFGISDANTFIEFEELGLTYESGTMYGTHESTMDEKQQPGSHGAILLGGRHKTTKSKVH